MKKLTFEDIHNFYAEGRWTKGQVKKALELGQITEEQYEEIVGAK